MKSEKKKLGKAFAIAWVVVASIVGICVFSAYNDYGKYKEGQDLAIEMTLLATKDFDSYKDNREVLIEKIYNYYNQTHRVYQINGYTIDNKDVIDSLNKADRALGTLLTELGYSTYYGSYYFRYKSFGDYYSEKMSSVTIVLAVLCVALLIANLVYQSGRNSELSIHDGIIEAKQNGSTTQFLLKDVKSVTETSFDGLQIKGEGINHEIRLLKNRKELKDYITGELKLLQPSNDSPPSSSTSDTESLLKLKELLDAGIITEEEFDAKKKQILNI